MGTYTLISVLLLFGLCHTFPQKKDAYLFQTSEEIDSSEHGQFQGPKSTNCSCGWTNKGAKRIVGGRESDINEFPHMAGLVRTLYSGRIDLFCGSSIITPFHALTAAHCTVEETLPLSIVVGEHDINDDKETSHTKRYPIKKVVEHPDYDPETDENDIALLITIRKITFTLAVGPICLPNRPMNDFLVDKYVKVTGWGDQWNNGRPSNQLLKVNLRVIPLKQCSAKYKYNPLNTRNPTQICTYGNGKDSCQGDSGGPVTWLDPETNRYTLIGLVSFGGDCASDYPGVNTDVYAFMPWIQSEIRRSSAVSVNTCAKID